MVFLQAPATRKDRKALKRRGLRKGPVSGLAGLEESREDAPSQSWAPVALGTLGRGFASAPPEAYRCGGSAGLTPASRLSPEPAKARGHRLTIMSSLAKA